MSEYDVVIVGAGAVGCSVARTLAPDHDVLVLEKDGVAEGAAGHAAGFVSDWWAHEGVGHPDARRIVREFFREFDGTGSFAFDERPFLTFIDDEDDVDGYRGRDGTLPDGFEYYSPEELEATWPDTFDCSGTAGAIVDEDAGALDPYTFTVALAEAARARGAEIRTGSEVTAIRDRNGSVTGVDVGGGETVTASTVVVAAGAFTRGLVADYVDLPTRSFVFSNARVAVDGGPDPSLPMGLADGVYWRPDGGDLFVSGGEFWLDERTRGPGRIPERFRREVASTLPRYLADVDGMRYVATSEHTCPEGVTVAPDFAPIVDRLDRPDGLVVVDGVYGGIAMAPAYAEAIRSLVTGAEPPFPLSPFRTDRFESTSLAFDFDHIDDLP